MRRASASSLLTRRVHASTGAPRATARARARSTRRPQRAHGFSTGAWPK
ncbi:Hypothetical protein A7982_11439 [Minicystis rosea]|nr:Hypothetical protein A7982_11439 [Minicystis rosea]